MPDAIKVEKLTKKFDGFVAVDNVSFSIKSGEIFGLLGPNGAGKTTLTLMFSTLLNPTSGTAKVCGYDIIEERDKVRESIGIVFEEPALDNRLTGKEHLDFHARMYHINKKDREKQISEALELVEMDRWANEVVKNYSGGMQRRLEMARGIMMRPKVLFLDEPTTGLDVQTRTRLWDVVKKMNKEGVTVILSTHYIEEADYLCNRIGIMDHGIIRVINTPDNLKAEVGKEVILLKFANAECSDFVRLISNFEWIDKYEEHDGYLNISVNDSKTKVAELVRIAKKNGLIISSIKLNKPGLNDVLLRYIGKKIKDT